VWWGDITPKGNMMMMMIDDDDDNNNNNNNNNNCYSPFCMVFSHVPETNQVSIVRNVAVTLWL
jgi:hypothetical protein